MYIVAPCCMVMSYSDVNLAICNDHLNEISFSSYYRKLCKTWNLIIMFMKLLCLEKSKVCHQMLSVVNVHIVYILPLHTCLTNNMLSVCHEWWWTEGVYFAAAHPFATSGLIVGSGVLAVKSESFKNLFHFYWLLVQGIYVVKHKNILNRISVNRFKMLLNTNPFTHSKS